MQLHLAGAAVTGLVPGLIPHPPDLTFCLQVPRQCQGCLPHPQPCPAQSLCNASATRNNKGLWQLCISSTAPFEASHRTMKPGVQHTNRHRDNMLLQVCFAARKIGLIAVALIWGQVVLFTSSSPVSSFPLASMQLHVCRKAAGRDN